MKATQTNQLINTADQLSPQSVLHFQGSETDDTLPKKSQAKWRIMIIHICLMRMSVHIQYCIWVSRGERGRMNCCLRISFSAKVHWHLAVLTFWKFQGAHSKMKNYVFSTPCRHYEQCEVWHPIILPPLRDLAKQHLQTHAGYLTHFHSLFLSHTFLHWLMLTIITQSVSLSILN